MSVTTVSVIGLVILALLFDYTNGFHDSANSISTIVATRVLRPRLAVLWAAAFNFVAFMVFGTAVANTVASTVKSQYFGLAVVFSALLGAIIWNYLSWWRGLPTSSSHALVGGLVGAGLASGGLDAIKGSSLEKTALFIVLSPVVGMLLGGLVMLVLRAIFGRRDVGRTERGFRTLQLASSAAVSLGHGANDAQKTMGVIAGLLVATGHLAKSAGSTLHIPIWVALVAESAIALGTLSGGWRIVRTMGMKITQLRPVSGFAAETSAAVALFASTALGAPVSTTHTVAGAITGVGTTNRKTTVDWGIFGQLIIAWVITLPFAGVVAALIFTVTTMDNHVAAGIIMSCVVAALAVLLTNAIRRAPKASDVAADVDQLEHEIPFRTGAGSVIAHGEDGPAGDRSPPRAGSEQALEGAWDRADAPL